MKHTEKSYVSLLGPDSQASKAFFNFRLDEYQLELILNALHALNIFEETTKLPLSTVLSKSLTFFNFEPRKIDSDKDIGVLVDLIFEPLYDYRFQHDLLLDDYDESSMLDQLSKLGFVSSLKFKD